MKKFIAAVMSVATLSAIMYYPVNYKQVDTSSDISVTNNTAISNLVAFADDYEEIATTALYDSATGYEYMDGTVYTHAYSDLSVKIKDSDTGTTTDYSTWEDSDGFTYEIIKVTITHKDDNKTITDDVQYRVALKSAKSTDLSVVASREVQVPDEVQDYVATSCTDANGAKGCEILDSNKVTVIAASAFAGSYIKNIDLSGIKYIADNAFNKCSYITEITIPASVSAFGKGVFQNSGLKTLNIESDFTVIPENFCNTTALSSLRLAHPEHIKDIGASAFKATALTAYPIESDANSEFTKIESNAFENCTGIENLVLPDNVYVLQKNVFKGCSSIKTLKFGKYCIGADASSFANCTALTDITFNDNMEALGGAVFSGCTSLVSVEMPDGILDWVTSDDNSLTGWGFGNNMFANCTSLKSVKLPANLTKIPESVFNGCTALVSVQATTNIISVDKQAFKGCTSLIEVNMPNVTSIEESAFSGCTSLKTFEFLKVESIGKNAFNKCESLSSLITCNCKKIDSNAFSGCTGLKNIALNKTDITGELNTSSDLTLGDSVFSDCTNLEYAEVMASIYGKNIFQKCTSLEHVNFDATGMDITPEGMFLGCESLLSVNDDSDCYSGYTLDNIKIIGVSTFSGCSSLKSIDLSSVVIINKAAFLDCTSLYDIGTDELTAEDYGQECFKNCTSLGVRVNSKASTIGESAFYNSGISWIEIDGTAGTTLVIGNNAFANCSKLEKVTIHPSYGIKYSIGTSIFANCTSLESVYTDEDEITASMFSGCTNLTKVIIPYATVISKNAFLNCSSLEYLIYEDSYDVAFTTIGESAFSGCSKLKYTYCDANTSFTGASQYLGCSSIKTAETGTLTKTMFKDCTSLESVKTSATAVPDGTFANCTSLYDIDLSKFTSIGSSAFSNTAIGSDKDEIVLSTPNGIGNSAFENCTSIKKLTIHGSSIGDTAFKNCSFITDANLYVKTIGSNAFYGCESLRNLEIMANGTTPVASIGSHAFENCSVLQEATVAGTATIGYNAFGYTNNKVNSDFMLISTSGSDAETYATKNKILFGIDGEVDMTERINKRKQLGDVDGNGLVSITDAVKLQNWILGKSVPGICSENMDMNNDGSVDCFDMVFLKNKLTS